MCVNFHKYYMFLFLMTYLLFYLHCVIIFVDLFVTSSVNRQREVDAKRETEGICLLNIRIMVEFLIIFIGLKKAHDEARGMW